MDSTLLSIFWYTTLVCFIFILGSEKAVKFSFLNIYFFLFVFLVFFFIIDIYQYLGKGVPVMTMILSVGPLFVILGVVFYTLYLLIAHSKNIIAEKVDKSYYTYINGQTLLVFITGYMIIQLIQDKNSFFNPATRSMLRSISMGFLVMSSFMVTLAVFLNTVLTYYKADGFTVLKPW